MMHSYNDILYPDGYQGSAAARAEREQEEAKVLRDDGRLASLTEVQRTVLTAMCEGQTTEQIAKATGLAIKTIEGYRSQIFKKLKVRSMGAACYTAARLGLRTAGV